MEHDKFEGLEHNSQVLQYEQPLLSYPALAFMALEETPCNSLTFNEICDYIMKKYPYYREEKDQS